MAARSSTQRYILLPANQIQTNRDTNPDVEDFLVNLSGMTTMRGSLRLNVRNAEKAKKETIQINVVDSIHENGAKLVSIKEGQLADFRFSYPGLRIIPEKFYRRAFRRETEEPAFRRSAARRATGVKAKILITDRTGQPIKDVYVVAFTAFDTRTGGSGTTNTKGEVTLSLDTRRIDRIYVYPDHTYWGFFRKSFQLSPSFAIKLIPIDLEYTDSLRYFYPSADWPVLNKQIRVGVIDTGFGPHSDVAIKGGQNMVLDEDPVDFTDREGHGTHVAGIIAAQGQLRGLAAGAELYIYRVFPVGDNASNYDIMKAIDRAKTDGCDLVNMSLGEEDLDEGIVSSIKDAYNEGMVCFAANGNDDRSPVSFPASYSLCLAVSAMGRKKTFPARTVQTGIVKAPYGKDKANFIADFSNVGPETDLTAPGVGIISTFPENRYAVMDGTSMACPAAVGMAARLLAAQPAILSMARNQKRSDSIVKFLSTKVRSLGFDANFEGKGMLFP